MYILFLWDIVVSDFVPLEIHKHLRAESIPFLFFCLWHCLNSRLILGWNIKSYLGPVEIASFSCQDCSRRNRHDLFGLVVSARYLYILFLWAIVNSDFVPLVTDKHLRAESSALLIFVLWYCFNCRWKVGWGIKSYLKPAEIASFSWLDLNRSNKHDLFWLVVSARCLYILFLWSIVVSVFLALEIHKHLRAQRIAFLIFFLWHCLNSRCIVGWGIKSDIRPAESASFTYRGLRRRNKHDLFWLVVSARSLYIRFLWGPVFPDFLPLQIYKHLRAESIFLLIIVLWHCFNSRWIVGWGIKSCVGTAERISLLIFAFWHCFNSRWIVS